MKSEIRNWSDIRVFLAVVREGSTLAASRKLGLAQPTVARRIDALEGDLGLTLFERDTRGFRPTENARSLIALADGIEVAAEELANKVQSLKEQRPIRVTASGSFADHVTDLFSDFVAFNPGVTFEFLASVKALDLLKGEADVAFRVALTEPDERLVCRRISTAQWALFGGRRYAERYGLPGSVKDLKGHKFVTFTHEDVPGHSHDWLLHHVSEDQIVMSFSEVDLLQASIRAGHGLGLVNLRMAAGDDGLFRCFEPIEELSRPTLMLVSPEAYRRPEVRAFTKFFAPRYAATFK